MPTFCIFFTVRYIIQWYFPLFHPYSLIPQGMKENAADPLKPAALTNISSCFSLLIDFYIHGDLHPIGIDTLSGKPHVHRHLICGAAAVSYACLRLQGYLE